MGWAHSTLVVVVRVVLCNTLMALPVLLCPSLKYHHTHFVKIIQYRMDGTIRYALRRRCPIHRSLPPSRCRCLDGWMLGCLDVRARVDTARRPRCTPHASHRLASRIIASQTLERTDSRTDGRTNGRTDGRTDGRTFHQVDRSLARASLRGVTNIESTKRTRATTLESTKRRSGTLEGA